MKPLLLRYILCLSVAMKSFWKSVRHTQAARDLLREAVPALPSETPLSSFPVPKAPSSRILRWVCLFVQKYLFEGKADVIRPTCSSKTPKVSRPVPIPVPPPEKTRNWEHAVKILHWQCQIRKQLSKLQQRHNYPLV